MLILTSYLLYRYTNQAVSITIEYYDDYRVGHRVQNALQTLCRDRAVCLPKQQLYAIVASTALTTPTASLLSYEPVDSDECLLLSHIASMTIVTLNRQMQAELRGMALNVVSESAERYNLVIYDTRAMGSSAVDAQRVRRQYLRADGMMVFRDYQSEYITEWSTMLNGVIVWNAE